jgi:hypothetical protein
MQQQNPLVSYIIKLTFFSIAVCFIGLFSLFFLKDYISPNLPYYIVIFYLCTGIGYSLNYFLIRGKKMKFENIFMLTKFGKLFIYIIVFLIVLFLKKENIIPFTILYLILYTLYLIFDTITLKNLSKKIK